MSPLSETETRQQLIDQQLAKAGWVSGERNFLTEYYLTGQGKVSDSKEEYLSAETGFADYVLLGKDGKPMAIVEAKRTSRDAIAGKRQASDYADQIKSGFGFDPFVFLTNGQTILFWDRDRYAPREVNGFFRREDLERLSYLRRYSMPLNEVVINHEIAGRDYQLEAIRRITEAIPTPSLRYILNKAKKRGSWMPGC